MISMARKYEFKPDKPRTGLLGKLFLTQNQRKILLKWVLYALVLLGLSVLQDVLLCRVRIFGATTELVPMGIFLICLAEGAQRGSIFVLIASCLYLFSGTAAGNYTIVFITAYGLIVTCLRQAFLQKSLSATMLCAAVAMVLYEFSVFLMGLFFGMTTFGRIGGFFVTALLTMIAAPILHPLILKISNIGGEAWKE